LLQNGFTRNDAVAANVNLLGIAQQHLRRIQKKTHAGDGHRSANQAQRAPGSDLAVKRPLRPPNFLRRISNGFCRRK